MEPQITGPLKGLEVLSLTLLTLSSPTKEVKQPVIPGPPPSDVGRSRKVGFMGLLALLVSASQRPASVAHPHPLPGLASITAGLCAKNFFLKNSINT